MLTCQRVDQFSYPEVTLTVNGFPFTQTTNTYTSSTITVTDRSSSLPATASIVSSQFEGQYVAQCSLQLPVAPHAYSSLSSTQATSDFIYAIESSFVTIPITPFAATKIPSVVTDPVFTYSLDSYFQPPNGVTVTAATGDIVISSPSTLGVAAYTVVIEEQIQQLLHSKLNNVKIEGKLQDCQTITATFTLTGYSNTPPSFFGITGAAFPDLPLEPRARYCTLNAYPFPTIIDPDTAQTISVTLIDGGNNAYPIFADFTDATNTAIALEPSFTTNVGFYPVLIRLNDGVTTTTYDLNIVITAAPPPPPPPPPTPPSPPNPITTPDSSYIITNQGPPFFTSPLSLDPIAPGTTSNFTLPTQQDPDYDSITVTVNLGAATIFATYDKVTQTITFKPEKGVVYREKYEIEVVLTDGNVKAQSSMVKIMVVVNKEVAKEDKKSDKEIADQIQGIIYLYK